MEFAIPISRFDPNHVTWNQPRPGSFRKTVPFGYTENGISFNSLITVLEPLKVVEIDWDKNQLVLEEFTTLSFLSKLDQFQKSVNTQISTNFRKLLDDNELPDSLAIAPLQSCVKGRRITLYLSNDPSQLSFFMEGSASRLSKDAVKPGDLIRAVIRLYGISLQMTHNNIWTGKSRIQHHVLELYKVAMTD